MHKSLIEHIAYDFNNELYKVLLVENSDGFLSRCDVQLALSEQGIRIELGPQLLQRVSYELRDPSSVLVLVCDNHESYLEDMQSNSSKVDFFLDEYISGYHLPTIVNQPLEVLEKLYCDKQIIQLNKSQTIKHIEGLSTTDTPSKESKFNLNAFIAAVDEELNKDVINWKVLCKTVAEGIVNSIGKKEFDSVIEKVNEVNDLFQEKIQGDYQQTKVSSYIKRPQIVSHVLNYLDYNFKADNIALIVVDGLSYWQYILLSQKLNKPFDEDVIYSWLPSITQLSRQAIFKGGAPDPDYKQGPTNEDKLWRNYWKEKGINDFEIRYDHQKPNLSGIKGIKRYAIVYKDLDDCMHNSKDYKDLLDLTVNWIERSKIVSTVESLLSNNFRVFLTTDHGNVQARGWRSLQGGEKLGTNKSGSRSERHLEYSEDWLKDEFLKNNPEIKDSIIMEDRAVYFKNDLSFSRDETLVTHGGAHFLEVLIPFIKILNEE